MSRFRVESVTDLKPYRSLCDIGVTLADTGMAMHVLGTPCTSPAGAPLQHSSSFPRRRERRWFYIDWQMIRFFTRSVEPFGECDGIDFDAAFGIAGEDVEEGDGALV